ncbi:IS1 family transposase [Escherichia coli]
MHVISKRYTQRIERHNLNLRQHLARLGQRLHCRSKINGGVRNRSTQATLFLQLLLKQG